MSNAYMIAGNAISPLLNISGDVAMAMACAAFCMPTSMTIVRLVPALELLMRDIAELHSIASIISKAPDSPNRVKLSAISRQYCMKNTVASVMSAGNANFPSTFAVFMAAVGHSFRKRLPDSSGTNNSTIFCINSLPTGR